jgi:hypothetical protein
LTENHCDTEVQSDMIATRTCGALRNWNSPLARPSSRQLAKSSFTCFCCALESCSPSVQSPPQTVHGLGRRGVPVRNAPACRALVPRVAGRDLAEGQPLERSATKDLSLLSPFSCL